MTPPERKSEKNTDRSKECRVLAPGSGNPGRGCGKLGEQRVLAHSRTLTDTQLPLTWMDDTFQKLVIRAGRKNQTDSETDASKCFFLHIRLGSSKYQLELPA